MDDLTVGGNLIESAIWFLFSATFGVLSIRGNGRRRRLFLVLAIAFAAFAVSDVIESRTGAWWRPTWLLLLKGGCLAVFGFGVFEYRSIQDKCRVIDTGNPDGRSGGVAIRDEERDEHRDQAKRRC